MSDEPTPPPSGWSPEQPPPSREGYAGSTPPPPQPGPPPAPPPASGWGPPPAPPPTPGWGAVPRADQPGVVPLQPLGLGQIYEGAFATLRRSWRALGAITALMAVLVFAVSLLGWLSVIGTSQTLSDLLTELERLGPNETPTDAQLGAMLSSFGHLGLVLGALSMVVFLANLIVTGATTVVVGRAVIGQPVTAGLLWRELRPRLLSLIGTALLVALGVAGGLVLCLIPGLIFAVFWLVSTPAVVLERCGPITAMRRSWRLVSGSWWRVLGLFALTYLIVYLVAGVISAPLQAVLSLGQVDQLTSTGSSATAFLPTTGIAAFGYALSQAVTVLIAVPLLSCVLSLLYIDLRIRKENLAPTLSAAARAQQPGS